MRRCKIFPDGARLVNHLAGLLRVDGLLTVAHGFSRETINAHHAGSARHVSNGLPPMDGMRRLFAPALDVVMSVSDDEMYQIVGAKRPDPV